MVSIWIVISLTFLSLCNIGYTAPPNSEGIALKNAILKPSVTISIAAGVPGVIAKVIVQEGDVLPLNAPLVQIRDDESRLSHERACLALETAVTKANRDVDIRMAMKSAEVAEQELNRTLKANSLAADTYPANEVDRYRLVFERAKIEIERSKLDQQLAALGQKQAEVEVRQTQQAIDRHAIRCPMHAMVVAIEKREGEWVDPSSKILEIMSTERLRIEGFVDSNDALAIEKGRSANVNITVSNTTQSIRGKVLFVSPTANPVNGQVRVAVEIENRESKFRPGMPVSVEIARQ